MIFSELWNKKFGLQLRLTHLTLLLAFLLACLLAVSGFSTALAIDTPQLITPFNFEETTGNPNDPISGRVSYEPLGIPTFEWSDVGASKYELEVATTAAFGASVIFRLDNLQYTTYTPNGEGEFNPGFSLTEDSGIFNDYATFYWHVRAWDTDLAAWGSWSPARSFTRHWGYEVGLLYPADNSVESQTPYFEWESVPGASFYQIQVDTSDSFGSLLVNETVDVPIFTPRDTFQNDTDLFWRVRAFHRPNNGSITGGRGGPWSEVRQFQMAWSSKTGTIDTRPLQLMPADNATLMTRPLFCWKPVEGALKYRLDLATHPDFVVGSVVLSNVESQSTCYYANRDGTYTLNPGTTYYWRVTAYDAKNYPGQRTDEGVGSAAFQFQTGSIDPPQVPAKLYPFPYYEPIMADTFEDRTVALPTFMWDHVRGATSYELRLDDDAAMTDPPVVVVTTENTSYTFTDADTIPLDGNTYYWRVRALGAPQGEAQWTQILDVWPIRIDRSLVDVHASVKLIQPTYQTEPWTGGFKHSQESVTYYPSFSWTAVAPIGQAAYQFQIANDSSFSVSSLIHNVQTELTEYTPLDRPEPGNYFWRVRQALPTTGSWSETGRFIVSRNFTFVLPDPTAEITVDGDPADWVAASVPFYSPSGEDGDTTASFDMSGFYIANDSYNWYFGIDLPTGSDLGLYFDIDHFDLSGGTPPPEGDDPGFPEAHQPEFAIYWAEGSPDNLGKVYEWNGASWTYRGPLSNILATQSYNATNEFLELKIPVTQLDQPGSLSVMMVTMNDSGTIQDKIPNLPEQATEATFLTESTTPTPLFPANAPQDESLVTIEHNTPVLTWRHNEAGYSGAYFFETFEDETLSNYYDGENGNVPKLGWFFAFNTFWAPQIHYSDNNSYHWRIARAGFQGATPLHFQKAAYLPTNLQFFPADVSQTYTNRTPSFSWQPAQSAPRYVWQLWEGGVRKLEFITMVPYYTPQDAIKDGTYTWKVYAKDARNRNSAEAAQSEFSKVSEVVQVLGVEYTNSKLTFLWKPVDFAAHYRFEIADDPQFSNNYWTATTYNTTFTPRTVPRAAEDGAFYWRVYMYDNKNNAGPYIDLQFDLFPNKLYLPLTIRQ